jgi:hypothetical protein
MIGLSRTGFGRWVHRPGSVLTVFVGKVSSVQDAFDVEVAEQARRRASWLREMGFASAASELDHLALTLEAAPPRDRDEDQRCAEPAA